jgi:hypothetical protein
MTLAGSTGFSCMIKDCNIEVFLSRSMTVTHLGPSLKTQANAPMQLTLKLAN